MKKFIFILSLFISFSCFAQDDNLSKFEDRFSKCTNAFNEENKSCSDISFTKCYYKRMEAHKTVQKCYKQIVTEMFEKFYGLSGKEAQERFDSYSKFIYEQYFFLFSETNHCKKNNCGLSLYLYSEYATTKQIQDYINAIINSISARD
ncbi:MAG: hypothetical protein IJ689_05915 [Alphaproteobacteria bacterium]|nr:hypothetical protein [Alphaproteobacteria bacterium]